MIPPHLERQRRKAERRQAILDQGMPSDAAPETLADRHRKRHERLRRRSLGHRQAALERLYQTFPTRLLLDRLRILRGVDLIEDEIIEEWALRNVLATRPHVIRGEEARRRRQDVAKRQHGQGKSQNR